MPSGGTSTAVGDITVSEAKDAEIEARHEAQAGVIAGEEVTDSLIKLVSIEADEARYIELFIFRVVSSLLCIRLVGSTSESRELFGWFPLLQQLMLHHQ